MFFLTITKQLTLLKHAIVSKFKLKMFIKNNCISLFFDSVLIIYEEYCIQFQI